MRFCREGLISRYGPFPADSVAGCDNELYTHFIPLYLISAALRALEMACSSQIPPRATPMEWAHNPEVAGSNPAPATGKAPETGPFFCVKGVVSSARRYPFGGCGSLPGGTVSFCRTCPC